MVICKLLSVQSLLKAIFKNSILTCLFISSLLFVPNGYAQITSLLLLDDDTPGGPLEISLDNSLNQNYGYLYGSGNYKDGIDILFDRVTLNGQSQNITICLNAVDVQNNEVIIELNGEQVGSLINGENCLTIAANQQQAENTLKLIHQNPGDRWGVNNSTANFRLWRSPYSISDKHLGKYGP